MNKIAFYFSVFMMLGNVQNISAQATEYVNPPAAAMPYRVDTPPAAPTQVVVEPQITPKAVQSTEPQRVEMPLIGIEVSEKDFGTINFGEHPSHIFYFRNNLNTPLSIDLVSACDCTQVEYSDYPIAPNATGWIKATFLSERAYPENVNRDVEKELTVIFKNKYPNSEYPIVETLKVKVFVTYKGEYGN